jgi:hypothetical protein
MTTSIKDANSGVYEIRVRGELDYKWSDWFDGFLFTLIKGDTVLTGQVTDQAALHGILTKIRDLGLPLISVKQISKK